MKTVLAALDNSAAAHPVLSVAIEIARIFGAAVDAVHARETDGTTAEAAARAAEVPFRTIPGPVRPALVAAAAEERVRAVVLGTRGSRGGPRPAGHVALEIAASVRKPVVIVPPQCGPSYRLRSVLVPMSAEPFTSSALEQTIDLAKESDIEVIVLHVHDMRSLPSFEDQPQHDVEAWAREFVARWVPVLDPEHVRIEQRVGIPSEEIVEAAGTMGADLVVLGWAQDLSPGRAAVVRAMLERVEVPVALVRIVSVPNRSHLDGAGQIRLR
jgi:nucleotide-binding universal stress UspA family protein